MSNSFKNAQKLTLAADVSQFGALLDGVSDDSAALQAMLAAKNYIYIPTGVTCIAKNIALNNNSVVKCDGILKLPAGCSDFDRLLYAAGKTNICIDIHELDGNAANQSGAIGTHLVYLTSCDDATININWMHDHYISTAALMPSVDGIRNASSGPIFLQGSSRGVINVNRIDGWGREAIYVLDNFYTDVSLGHAEATGNTEYSGVQVSGSYNKILKASVNNAGASAIGFDTMYGTASNLVATNTRANQGINCGHPGRPATGSVISNVTVSGCYLSGIGVQSSSQDVQIVNANINNAGTYGISFSDGVTRGKVTNAIISNSGRSNLNTVGAVVEAHNVTSSNLNEYTLVVTMTTGTFAVGQTVTSASGSGVIAYIQPNLTGTAVTLWLTGLTGTFSATQTVSSGANSGTITVAAVPTQYNQAAGGVIADGRYQTGSGGNQAKLQNGLALYDLSTSVNATAGTLHTVTVNFASNVTWTSAPKLNVSISSASATGDYVLQTLSVSADTATLTIKFKASVSQIYGLTVTGSGLWM